MTEKKWESGSIVVNYIVDSLDQTRSCYYGDTINISPQSLLFLQVFIPYYNPITLETFFFSTCKHLRVSKIY